MPRLRLEPFGAEVECAPGETVLGAVLRSGFYLRYGCKFGGCGTCRVRLVAGEVADSGSTFALPSPDRDLGWILACSSAPLEDCVLDASSMGLSEPEFFGGDRVQVFEATLTSVSRLTPAIFGVELRLIDPPVLSFNAGQFVNVEVPGTEPPMARAFSLANGPAASGTVELLVKRLPGGAFCGYLESARPDDRLRLHGPFGLLRIRPSYRKMIMIAGGSGLAPILSMLTDLAAQGDRRPVRLFFGARTQDELYHLDRIGRLCEESAELEFVPVVERPGALWPGEFGLVTDAVARLMPSLRGYDAYVCGPPPMVAAALELLPRLGARAPNLYYDAFLPAT